jgi:sugar phosphate isomerase/epimerase
MAELSRRSFLQNAAALAGLSTLARTGRALAAPDYGGFRMGAQSYSFRMFTFEDSLRELKRLGLAEMEFFSGHIKPDLDAAGLAAVKETLSAQGVRAVGFGVERFTADMAANRAKFEFAKALGVEVLTADPDPDSFDSLDALTEEFGIKIAIHNHGPNHRYDKYTDTLERVAGHSKHIGACLDTGHCIRSGEKPAETIEKMGERLISMHLKDWTLNGPERILGEGDLDLPAVAKALKALKFTGPIMAEYELSPGNPAPDMIQGLANWAGAVAAA